MNLSARQMLFVNYLLDRLQFPPGEFRERYLTQLSRRCREFVNLASQPIRRNPKTEEIIFPKDHDFKQYMEQDGRLIPTRFNIVDLLLLECDIKSKRRYVTLSPSEVFISATDISHFTYCPVGWSIAKTFQLPKLISTVVGTSMHEQHRLLRFVRSRRPDGSVVRAESDLRSRAKELDCDSCTLELFRELSESVAVFVGTSDENDDHRWFVGTDDRYIGQPDYIFFNPRKNSHFVVEEKFHCIPRPPPSDLPRGWCVSHEYDPDAIERVRQRTLFYDNHLNQLRSYIYGIRDYGVCYGYLVYWRYYFFNDDDQDNEHRTYHIRIEQVRSCKVSRANAGDRNSLITVYSRIKDAMSNKEIRFDPASRSPSRCVGCVQNILCAHKTGRFDAFTYPYDKKYMQTQRVPFPEELRKKEDPREEDKGM